MATKKSNFVKNSFALSFTVFTRFWVPNNFKPDKKPSHQHALPESGY